MIEKEIGQGGMATVFLARDIKHNRVVALKLLRPEIARVVGTGRFLREIEIAARLHHPHILPLFDSGEVDGQYFYVMPFIAGESLRHRLLREGSLPQDAAFKIACDTALALEYAHNQGVIHRDIKPENLLLEGDEVLIADFGIARAVGQVDQHTLTETGIVLGTPGYMSPEQIAGERTVDGRTDIYSLGCVAYEMLTGSPPFLGPSSRAVMARHSMDAVPPVHTVRPQVPVGIEAAVTKALAKMPADRFTSAGDFAAALDRGSKTRPWRKRNSFRARLAVVAAGALAVLAGILAYPRLRPASRLDPQLIAIAPFEVLDPQHALWREGLVDVLASNLDGAGPLRTVASTVSLRKWKGRPDQASAAAFGRALGAGLTIYGRVLEAGADSLRIIATLFDVVGGFPVGEVDVRGPFDRMDVVIDSITINLLRQLGRIRPVGIVRRAALGFQSLPGLKAYLRGEQFYRRSQWDSAIAHYSQAYSLDNTSALALWRLSDVQGWAGTQEDTNSLANAVRVAALNHGLSPRDSILVQAGALLGMTYGAQSGEYRTASPWWSLARRLLATADEIERRYPDDPEAAFWVSEARWHFGGVLGLSLTHLVSDVDRAIALDSGFSPNYLHAVQFSTLPNSGVNGLRRYLDLYLRLDPAYEEGARLAADLLDPRKTNAPETRTAIDTFSADGLFGAYIVLTQWLDSAETTLRIAREFERGHQSEVPLFRDPAFRKLVLSEVLVLRGHMREAYALTGTAIEDRFGDLMLLGFVPRDTCDRVFRRWLKQEPAAAQVMEYAIHYWGTTGDTVSLRRFAGKSDSAANTVTDPDWRAFRHYMHDAAEAYLALARQDTVGALSRFRALPDAACPGCVVPRITRIRLLGATGQYEEAAAQPGRPFDTGYIGRLRVVWALEQARVEDRSGRRAEAIRNYQVVADAWLRADSELQPYVNEARAALRRLQH